MARALRDICLTPDQRKELETEGVIHTVGPLTGIVYRVPARPSAMTVFTPTDCTGYVPLYPGYIPLCVGFGPRAETAGDDVLIARKLMIDSRERDFLTIGRAHIYAHLDARLAKVFPREAEYMQRVMETYGPGPSLMYPTEPVYRPPTSWQRRVWRAFIRPFGR